MILRPLSISFTGSRHGMTDIQKKAFGCIMETKSVSEFHHGMCVGADTEAHDLCKSSFLEIHGHPPTNVSKMSVFPISEFSVIYEPEHYLNRNKTMVLACDQLIATPNTMEEQIRSGTWSTIRYAKKQNKSVLIILPDGSIKTYSQYPNWRDFFFAEKEKEYFQKLLKTLGEENEKHSIFPPANMLFRCFGTTPLENTRVVVLGQDPYHTRGQANGLCFAINKGNKPQPSIKNIFKEIKNQFGECPENYELLNWAYSGVLLLNTYLTVIEGKPKSHRRIGWEIFNKNVLSFINDNCSNLVFMLWGNDAQSNRKLIDSHKHLILESAHPSPLSANKGEKFFGHNHFVKANRYLESVGKGSIVWTR